MTKINYLPIKESLGYKNVRQALMIVFSVDLDNLEIQKGEDENFNFLFRYKDYEMTIGISSTGRDTQLEAGEGGLFNIWFSHYIEERFTVTFLYEILGDETIRRIYGSDEKSVERAFSILKNYLDSDKVKNLLEK